MKKYIAILRGINVGGRRKILMADLRQLIQGLGFKEVKTYIQSGNVFFNSDTTENELAIADQIATVIAEKYAFEVPVIVRTQQDIEHIIDTNPFVTNTEDDLMRLHITFLKEVPNKEQLDKVKEYDYTPDKFQISNDNVMIYCSGKYSDTKLSNKFFESKLKVPATTRNWKTVIKLAELAKS